MKKILLTCILVSLFGCQSTDTKRIPSELAGSDVNADRTNSEIIAPVRTDSQVVTGGIVTPREDVFTTIIRPINTSNIRKSPLKVGLAPKPVQEIPDDATSDDIIESLLNGDSEFNDDDFGETATGNDNSVVEIVFDKTTYTMSCPFFKHEFVFPEAKKGLEGNFFLLKYDIEAFKAHYLAYQNEFNQHIYDCSKPKTVKGIQKIKGSKVVREEIAETIKKPCYKFDVTPAKDAMDKYILPNREMRDLGISYGPLTEDKMKMLFENGMISQDDFENRKEYNGDALKRMAMRFVAKVNGYNKDKTGEFFIPLLSCK